MQQTIYSENHQKVYKMNIIEYAKGNTTEFYSQIYIQNA